MIVSIMSRPAEWLFTLNPRALHDHGPKYLRCTYVLRLVGDIRRLCVTLRSCLLYVLGTAASPGVGRTAGQQEPVVPPLTETQLVQKTPTQSSPPSTEDLVCDGFLVAGRTRYSS